MNNSQITALSTALLMVAPVALGESNVKLYGMIDTGLTYVSNEGVSANYRADDSKMYGTRLGVTGSEDLGAAKQLFSPWKTALN